MRRLSAPLAFLFVVSLLLASYGHCGPMLTAQIALLLGSDAHHAHHHHDQSPVDHAQHAQLADPAVHSLPPAIASAPLAKESVPVLLAIAIVPAAYSMEGTRPVQRARAGPSPFTVFHARTGRLLI